MDTLPYHRNLDLDTTAAELRPSSKDTGSVGPVDKTSTIICKSKRRTHSPSNHSQRDTRDTKGQRKPPNACNNSQDDGVISEEQGNGKVNLGDGSDSHEEALRAMESYAAFQVTLLHYLVDDSTLNEHPRQILLPGAVFQPGPLSEHSMSDSARERRLDQPLTAIEHTNSQSPLS